MMIRNGIFSGLLVFMALGSAQVSAETIYGLTDDNRIVSFSSTSPNVLNSNMSITNLAMGERLVGIDFRPANRQLYAVGASSRLYSVNTGSGMATEIGQFNVPLTGSYFGVDFNPVADRLRVVSDANQNLRINPDTAVVATNVSPAGDLSVAFAGGDINAGTDANVVAAAYTNNVAMAASTTLYVIDSNLDVLATQIPPNNGVLNTVGQLSFNIPDTAGFDISGVTATAYLTSGNNLWTLNLMPNMGQLTAALVGSIGVASGANIIDISAAPVPEPATTALLAGGLIAIAAFRRKLT